MSPAAYSEPTPVLRAERGGLAPTATVIKMTPAQIGLSLSADVLRLPYPPATRLVLAEIVSLHAATGRCDCSDAHFAARLTISRDTASRAVQQLEADGLVVKVVDQAAGFHRSLTPVATVIAVKSESNPYPQNAATYPQNAARGSTRKMPVDYPQNAASPTRKMPDPLAANSDTNIPVDIPSSFHQSSSTTPFSRGDAAQGPESVLSVELDELVAEVVEPEVVAEAQAPKKKVAPKKKAPERAGRTLKPEVPFLESELASYEAFAAAFEGTDYELADLRYYHEKIKNWRQKGEAPRRKDWLATAKQFFLNDAHDNRLKLASGVQFHTGSPGEPVGTGTGTAGYRASRWDA